MEAAAPNFRTAQNNLPPELRRPFSDKMPPPKFRRGLPKIRNRIFDQFRNWPLLLLLGIWVSVLGMVAKSETRLKSVVKLRQKKVTSHFQAFQKLNDNNAIIRTEI